MATLECGYCEPRLCITDIKIRKYYETFPPGVEYTGLEIEYTMCLKDMRCAPPVLVSDPIPHTGFPAFTFPRIAPPGHDYITARMPRGAVWSKCFWLPHGTTFAMSSAGVLDTPHHGEKLTPRVCCKEDSHCCEEMKEALCDCVAAGIRNLGCGPTGGGTASTNPVTDTLGECCWVSCFKINPQQLSIWAGHPANAPPVPVIPADFTLQQLSGALNRGMLRFRVLTSGILADVSKSMMNLIGACQYGSMARHGVFYPNPEEPSPHNPLPNWVSDCYCPDQADGRLGNKCP